MRTKVVHYAILRRLKNVFQKFCREKTEKTYRHSEKKEPVLESFLLKRSVEKKFTRN